MKVLVTGADGFIGSHLTEALVVAGHDVRAFVFYNSFNSWGWLDEAPVAMRERLDVVAGDIRDPHHVADAVEGCDCVIHLAALIAIPFSYHAPDAYVDTNIKGTLNVLQAARRHRVGKVLHTSTSEVYGSARFVPITEEHPLQGQSPYSATKIAADQMALAFHASFGTPVSVIRPFNTYGPRQSARAIIPTVISQIAAGERDIRLGSLHPTRDFSFVADTVAGFLAALRTEAGIGEVLNLGTGHEISIAELVRLVAQLMKVTVSVNLDETRVRPAASEVDRLCASNEKARRLLDWAPAYAGEDGLRRGLTLTAEWFTQSANIARYKTGRYNI